MYTIAVILLPFFLLDFFLHNVYNCFCTSPGFSVRFFLTISHNFVPQIIQCKIPVNLFLILLLCSMQEVNLLTLWEVYSKTWKICRSCLMKIFPLGNRSNYLFYVAFFCCQTTQIWNSKSYKM